MAGITPTLTDLAERVRRGERRSIARALTLVETGGADAQALLSLLHPHTGRAHLVGVTGAPGTGKSTLVNALAGEFRRRGHRVGVVAIDPTSPYTGGAILGDRIRMQSHHADEGVFIRSMATRGHLGGLAVATGDAVRVLDAAGFDPILIETVGAGQSEVDIAGAAHTTAVVLVPGLGDDIQAIKAGILEIADIFVVNKADRDGVSATTRDLRGMLALNAGGDGAWVPPIVPTVATTGEGVDDVVSAVERHREWSRQSGDLYERRLLRLQREIEGIALDLVRDRLSDARHLAARVLDGEIDPYRAAQDLIDGL